MQDEGYIKYDSHWSRSSAPDIDATRVLEQWRHPLYEAGLIGQYEDLGIGYGNISIRCGAPGQFLISGTQTGHLATTDERHYSLVTGYDIERNAIHCRGPVQASSEAMTHAAMYALQPGIGAIVHVHSKALWNEHINRVPTTDPAVAYGTPEMAVELTRLYTETAFGESGLAVMAGHDEGLISFGKTLEQAARRMLNLLRSPRAAPD